MKDIIIKWKSLKKELIVWSVCFILSFLTNVYAVIKYKSAWTEIFWSIGFVTALSIIFYLIVLLIRFSWILFKKIFKSEKSK